MDNLRLFLWMGLGMLLFLTYQAWQRDYPPPMPVAELPAEQTAAGVATTGDAEQDLPALPEAPGTELPSTAALPSPDEAPAGRSIRIRTDVLEVEIGLRGGDIRAAVLPAYPIAKDRPNEPVELLTSNLDAPFFFRTGIRAADGSPEATHLAEFTAPQSDYELAAGQEQLEVVLNWVGAGDIGTEKIYRFKRGRYDIELEQRVTNSGDAPYRAVAYQQIYRRHLPPERSMFDVDSYSFVGPVIYNGEKYEKLDPDDLLDEPVKQSVTNGWLATIQHHFLAAVVPPAQEPAEYQVTYDGKAYTESVIGSALKTVEPGSSESFPARLFIGPKLQSQLEETAPGLPLTVDYGVLTLLAQPLFWVLKTVHKFVGNWGWTIVIVTFLIKLVFYKLTETSGRSMAKMRKMQPRMKALQERYKDDREGMSKALMELYKREKVNPAAGCLPMLVQIPFFIAFYWVLLESVEMRQAPFMLWITDLSSRDPFFILPLLMGAAMWFQQKLNPAPPDPMQAKVMQFLPVVFTGMFAFFPAGLVLYWLTNSVLSMAQQWRINKVVGAD